MRARRLYVLAAAVVVSLIVFMAVPKLTEENQPVVTPSGWYCETREGTCWFTRQQCGDNSCHWRRRVYATTYHDDGMWMGNAFETEGICKSYRKTADHLTSACKKVTPAQFIELAKKEKR